MAWGVVRTHGGEEARAEENLRRQGYTVLLPRFRARVKRRGRWLVELQPLFPRYLFVEIDGAFRSIFGTRGVAELFMEGESPALVRRGEIEALCADAEGIVDVAEVSIVGSAVLVEGGVFDGHRGLCTGMLSGGQRATVLLQMLGRSVSALVDAGQLAAA